MAEQKAGSTSAGHQVIITGREMAKVSGVLHVESFDDQEIILTTDLGTLTILGQEMQIKNLDLDSGAFSVEGVINSLQYSAGKGAERTRGFLGRLLK